MGAEGAVEIIMRRQVEEADDPAAKKAELIEAYRKIIDVYIAARQRHDRRRDRPARDAPGDRARARDGGAQAGRAAVEAPRRRAGLNPVAHVKPRPGALAAGWPAGWVLTRHARDRSESPAARWPASAPARCSPSSRTPAGCSPRSRASAARRPPARTRGGSRCAIAWAGARAASAPARPATLIVG